MLNVKGLDLDGVCDQLISEKEMFTSVDIANALKRQGIWISNSDVAAFLRAFNWEQVGYVKSTIPVNGGKNQATLYHPNDSVSSDYDNTDQEAIDPKEFYNMTFNGSDIELAEVEIRYSFVRTISGEKAKEFVKKIERIR